MYSKYQMIFGLTGSAGGDEEREYLRNTYGASIFEVPQFLNCCTGTSKKAAVNRGVYVFSQREKQLAKVVDLAFFHAHKSKKEAAPVLIIAASDDERNELFKLLQEKEQEKRAAHRKMHDSEVQIFKDGDEGEWKVVLERGTKQIADVDGGDPRFRITV